MRESLVKSIFFERFSDDYIMNEFLGKGNYGSVIMRNF